MEKILFDSHCHIADEAFSENREALIEEIRNSALRFAADIGSDLKTSVESAENASKYDFCYAACGYHPSEVQALEEEFLSMNTGAFEGYKAGTAEFTASQGPKIGALYVPDAPEIAELPPSLERCLGLYIENPKVVAIGEIGLDYHFDDGPDRKIQQRWFMAQLKEAIKLKAPVCIHSRDAEADTMAILKASGIFSDRRKACFPKRPDGSGDARVLLHCFSGSAETARQYVELGAEISLAGPVTFKNARKPAEVAASVPLFALLIETDSPYMAPVPMRGNTNKPVYVEYVARKIAELKGLSYEEVARTTLENACRFYGISC